MDKSQNIFDKLLYRKRQQRANQQVDFLHNLVEEHICERLDTIKKTFANVLVYGASARIIAAHAKIGNVICADMVACEHTDLVCDDEALPFANDSFDAIFSVLHLHHANDLAGALIQMELALKPDGLLLVAVAGVHSLRELRECLNKAEIERGGVSPHIAPFMDIRDAGALLQRAGLKLPVVDDEIINLSYENMFSLMHELRLAGEANVMVERRNNFTAKTIFMNAATEYAQCFSDAEGRVSATAHVLYLTAWKADISQQKPLQRGSGKLSLKEAF